ncbi:hypothetical protein HPP92_005850 [Vanilla planifolia]|uniref:Uncharacterized protein n=1 Tax=Vanilla planifolia TaxID=51239 RepID=A0A835RV95_VANPL|nr:hypothetical protein HPP92_005850 [Vanilla planifolia]
MEPEKLYGVTDDGEQPREMESPEKPRQNQFYDVDDGEEEDLVTTEETEDTEQTVEDLHQEINDLRRHRSDLHRRMGEVMAEMERSNADSRSLGSRVIELEGELIRLQEDLTLALSEKEEARAEAESHQRSAKILEDDKGLLEFQLRMVEAGMDHLNSVKDEAESLALKKEGELRSVNEELEVNLEKARAFAKGKEEEIICLKEELKKYNEDLEMGKGNAKAMVLKKDEDAAFEELRAAREKINEMEAEKEKTLAMASGTKDEINSLKADFKSAIEKHSSEMATEKEKARVAAEKQEEVINSFKEELRIAVENAKVLEIEKDKILMAVSKAEEEITFLKDELKAVREMASAEIATEKEARISVTEVINSLMEELQLTKEMGREELEIEKKKTASVVAEKESEIVALKQELVLVRDQGMEEMYVQKNKVIAEKEVGTFSVKGQFGQATVDTQRREEELEKEVKQLKDFISELEGKLKGLEFNVDSNALAQNNHEVNLTEERPKISWVVIAASTGTVVAAITAFFLHQSRRS